jgi:NDP-sugar pyrophosphorylase family protein
MVARFQGAIIAAGHGERLRAGGESMPKPLVELAGEPLLIRQTRSIVSAGAETVLTVINSETARLIEERETKLPSALRIAVRDTPNSMETLFALGERLSPGHFLLTTVDAIAPPGDLERFTRGALDAIESDSGISGVLGVNRWRGDHRPLFVSLGQGNSIEAFGDARSPMVTAGVYFFSTRIFELMAQARAAGCGALREFLAYLVAQGLRLKALEIGEIIDIDEVADLDAARAMLEREEPPKERNAK